MPDINSWHDYFVMVGGGSAALTGLIFVAMTLHLDEITTNPVHRHRARTILMGLTVVEFLLYSSIRQAMSSADRGVLLRTLGSFACLLLEEAGAIVLFFGHAWGLYIVGLGMMSSFIFMVTGAWLLLVGVGTMEAAGA